MGLFLENRSFMDEQGELGEDKPLCPKCGTVMEEKEKGEDWICPKCASEIDYFGDREEEEKE